MAVLAAASLGDTTNIELYGFESTFFDNSGQQPTPLPMDRQRLKINYKKPSTHKKII